MCALFSPYLAQHLERRFRISRSFSICAYFAAINFSAGVLAIESSKNRSGQQALWSHATTASPPARKIYGPKRGSQTANILDGVILVDHRVHGVILVVDRQNFLAIESYLDKRLVSLWKPESVDLLVLPHEVSSFDPE